MKLVNKLKKVLLIFIMTIFMFGSINVEALSDTLKTGASSSRLPTYIGETFFAIKKLDNGTLVYCLEHHKSDPIAGLTYKKVEDVTSKYPGFIYILQNGYPNKKAASKYLTGNSTKDYYITQTAIHWYTDRIDGISDNATSGGQLGSWFKVKGPNTYGMRKYVKALVEDAIKYTKDGSYNSKPTVEVLGNGTMHMIDDDNWMSELLSIKTEGNVGSTYKVSLVNAPEGAQIIDSSGNEKSQFSVSEGFMVRVPASSITDETSFEINVSIAGTMIKAYRYSTSNSDYQDILVTGNESTNIDTTASLRITDIPDKEAYVTLAKVDNNNQYVAGAKLRLNMNFDGITYNYEFVSSEEPLLLGLTTGTYYFEELEPPVGYIKSDKKICFRVNDNGEVLDCDTGAIITSSTGLDVVIQLTNQPNRIEINKKDINGNYLAGAELHLYKVNPSSNEEEGDTIEKEIGQWTSGTSSKVFEKLEQGWYSISEKKAPAGYAISDPVYFYVTDDGTIVNENSEVIDSIEVINEKTVTNIHKTDITGEKEIPGARLCIYDQNNNLVDKCWTSTTEPHEIQGLVAGKTYTLEETIAPSGYALTSAIQFTVNEDGSVTEVTLTNEVITLVISKQDITNNKELPGATLIIRDKDGNEYLKWVSGEEPKVIEMIPAGTYTLEEITSPDGYILNSEKITFIVNEDGTITDENGNKIDQVIMYNTPETPVPKTAANIPMFVYIIGLLALAGGAKIIYTKLKHN